MDGARTIMWVSPSVERVLGWRPEQIVGTDGATLLHPETSLVRVIGMSAAVELLLGGGSGTLANLGVLLTQLSYTRQAEEEADVEALSRLRGQAFRPRAWRFLPARQQIGRQKRVSNALGRLHGYVAHASPTERIRRVAQPINIAQLPRLRLRLKRTDLRGRAGLIASISSVAGRQLYLRYPHNIPLARDRPSCKDMQMSFVRQISARKSR
jgi:predicted Zn-dependent protease